MDAIDLKTASQRAQRTATISRLDLPQTAAHRLRAMGAFEGQNVEIGRASNTVILSIMGTRIAIANEAAEQIIVTATTPQGQTNRRE